MKNDSVAVSQLVSLLLSLQLQSVPVSPVFSCAVSAGVLHKSCLAASACTGGRSVALWYCPLVSRDEAECVDG